MKTVSVLYPKKNYSGFDYELEGTIMKRNYDEDGSFLGREWLVPSIEMYSQVSILSVPDSTSNQDIFEHIVRTHNIGSYPEKITSLMKEGLNVNHCTFSIGDIIKIEGCYYISNGYGFELLPVSFSNDQ